MKKEDFIKKAMIEISNDPWSRVLPHTKKVLEKDDCVIDIHAHIFERRCVNEVYFILKLVGGWVGDWIVSTLNAKKAQFEAFSINNQSPFLIDSTENIYKYLEVNADINVSWKEIEDAIDECLNQEEKGLLNIESFGFENLAIAGINIRETLKILKIVVSGASMREILDFYSEKYAIVKGENSLKGKDFVTGILLMDFYNIWNQETTMKYSDQVSEIQKIIADEPVLPFLAVYPERGEEIYQTFLDAFTNKEAPFFGLKIYPALGYNPSDYRLFPLYEICEAKNIPVVTHCGANMIRDFNKERILYESKDMNDMTIAKNVPADLAKKANWLNDPERWENVLEKFPKLKLNFGHFGSNAAWDNDEKMLYRKEAIIQYMKNRKYKGVYADFSYNFIDESTFIKFKHALNLEPIVKERAMFGTDFWVVMPFGNMRQMQDKLVETLKEHRQAFFTDNAKKYLFEKTVFV